MSPSSAQFLDVNRNDNNAIISSTTNVNGGTTGLRHNNIQYELVTQMALLIYLGEYTHARHLWERNSGRFNANDDYVQLEQLWCAAKYCCLWSTGGVYSLTSCSSSSSSSNGMMKVEANNNDKEDGGSTSRTTTDLPFSTIALRALDVCVSRQMEPLSTYATELTGVFRSRVNRCMHGFFEKLDCAEFYLRMNFNDARQHDANNDRENDALWTAYGWKKDDGGYLISSDVDDMMMNVIAWDKDMELDKGGMTPARKDEVDRISKLTEIVMFLESKMNA